MTGTMQNPYEDSIQTIDVVLRQIELNPKNRSFIFQSFDDIPILKRGPKELSRFLENLKTRGAIESYSIGPGLIFYVTGPNKKLLLKERRGLMEFEKISAQKTDNQLEKIVLFLNADGDLYREPKSRYCYPLSKEKMREKIIRFLIDKGYQQTALIQSEVGSIDTGSVRLAIGKINGNAKSLLGLKNKLIEGRKGSGYRINPRYKIQNS